MTTQYYIPEDKILLPPKNAEVLTTACDYCVVACGYKVYRWPLGQKGGPKSGQNALGVDFPTYALQAWIAPTQQNIVMHQGKPHHIVIIPDKEAGVVNLRGDSSIRGGLLAQKVYNPATPTHDRLKHPLMRIQGSLMPVTWDFALDVAAEVGNHVIKQHGANAYSVKTFSYGYIQNTFAITKFALRNIGTAAFTFHDTPADVTSTPGFKGAGFDNFAPSYKDWGDAEVLLICGTDPYETKTIIYTSHLMPAMARGQKLIMLIPRETAGVAHAKKMGGLHLDNYPGTDTLVLNAIARIIVENGWEDSQWIEKWVNRSNTARGLFQTKGFEDWKKWLFSQKEYRPEAASRLSGIKKEKLFKAAEMMAKPDAKGRRPKTSIGIEKGLMWSNNTGNTIAVSSLATLVGAGGRPGQMIGRFGGHQRGGVKGGKYPIAKSPEKLPNGKRRALDTDRWLVAGNTRLAYAIGTTWIQSMCASQGLYRSFYSLVKTNPHQVQTFDKQEIIETLKRRADSGGMVVFNQDIYLVDPIGNQFADIIFPASGWGEEDFIRANGERRLRLYQKFYDAPGEAKPDWWIVAQLAKRMGFSGFDWKNSNEVAEEAAASSFGSRKDFYQVLLDAREKGITLHDRFRQFGTEGIQGPVIRVNGKLEGTPRLHDTTKRTTPLQIGPDGKRHRNNSIIRFKTKNGKINLEKSPWSLFSDFWEWMKPKGEELWFTTGRINEVWQSGYDDVERRPYITQRWPENFVEIHPEDADPRGIQSGDRVMIYSERVPVRKDSAGAIGVTDHHFSSLLKNGHIELQTGNVTAIAMVTPAIKKGVLFGYFLDKRQPSNALQARVIDWVSGNYNYKMGSAKIKKIGSSKYREGFRTMSFAPRNITI